MPANKSSGGDYYIEYVQLGGSVKVSAIDPETGIEVSIIGSPAVSNDDLAKLAVRKLKYRLSKLRNTSPKNGEE